MSSPRSPAASPPSRTTRPASPGRSSPPTGRARPGPSTRPSRRRTPAPRARCPTRPRPRPRRRGTAEADTRAPRGRGAPVDGPSSAAARTTSRTETAPMVEQLTGHMVPDADIETILADPGGACPGCVRIVIEGLRAEVEQLRAERDAARVGMEKLRGLHRGVCVGACGLDDACECEERDLACAECAASWPCATIRALDGTEAGQ